MSSVDAFVLAGGRSRRMGFDKARAPFGRPPVPMALAVAASMRGIGERVALVRRGDDGLPWIWPDGAPVEVVLEDDPGEVHPLYGVVTAMRASRTPRCAVAPCDAPELTPAAWAALLAAAPAVAWDGARCTRWWPCSIRPTPTGRWPWPAPARRPTRSPRGSCVALPAEVLADRDVPAALGASPVQALLARVPVRDPARRARLAEGERARLLARGIVDPRPAEEC
ncbi:MAG: NTP transferase domain-containing protein [Myxococcota bacterium]